MSRSRSVNLLWPVLSFVAALGLALTVLVAVGIDDEGLHAALLATARLAFLLFWFAYAGGALASLFGSTFEPVRRRAREFGLAFAAALLVHLGLVASLYVIGDSPPVRTLLVFGIAALCVYGLALGSIRRLQHALGARAWSLLRFAGMNYVAAAFALDFLRDPFEAGLFHELMYWPFAALALAGPGLRVAAALYALRQPCVSANTATSVRS